MKGGGGVPSGLKRGTEAWEQAVACQIFSRHVPRNIFRNDERMVGLRRPLAFSSIRVRFLCALLALRLLLPILVRFLPPVALLRTAPPHHSLSSWWGQSHIPAALTELLSASAQTAQRRVPKRGMSALSLSARKPIELPTWSWEGL